MMSFGNRTSLSEVERIMLEFGLGNALLIEDLRFLYHLADSIPDNSLIIEIGTQLGRSTRVISMAALGSKIITIDPVNLWQGAQSDNIIRLMMRSGDAASIIDAHADMIFIDGDHTEEGVISDITNYIPKLKSGGILAFHDYHSNHPGVISAVDKFIEANNWRRLMPTDDEIGTACIAFVKP